MFNILQNSVKNLTNKTAGASSRLNHGYVLRYLTGCPVVRSIYLTVLCKQLLLKIKMKGGEKEDQIKKLTLLQS